MSPWEKLLERPHSREHFVQLGGTDELCLAQNVGLYLWEGLKRGGGALVIATPEHWERFRCELVRLGADPESLIGDRRLVVFDAQATLSRFTIAGTPDWQLFENVIGAAIRQVLTRNQDAGLRAYGEMVGLL